MLSNIVFNFMLAPFYGYVGLAIATAMSASLNAFMLYRGLHQQGVYQVTKQTIVWVIKLLVSTAVMSWLLYWLYNNWPLEMVSFSDTLIQLFGLIFIAAVSYFAAFSILGFRLKDLRSNF